MCIRDSPRAAHAYKINKSIVHHDELHILCQISNANINSRELFSLTLFVENCGQTAADGYMVIADSLYEVADGSIADPL